MDRHQLLQAVEQAGRDKLVSRDEVLSAYGRGAGTTTSSASRHINLAEILYYIGGAIVFLGIAVLVSQNWELLNDVTKIVATLGAAVAAYVVGTLFANAKKTELSYAFYLLSALIMPIGLYVAFEVAGTEFNLATHTLIAAILFAVYGLSLVLRKSTVFMLFTIIFGAWLFYAFTSYLVGTQPIFKTTDFIAYRFLSIGLALVFIGHAFVNKTYRALTGPLYSFGLIGSLSAALVLGGWSPEQNVFWELLFPGLVFAVIFLSIHLKSRAFLTFGTIYLMAYIIKITAEYFTNSLGWPLALVLAGLALIAIGYGSVYVSRRYFVKSTPTSA